MPNFVFVLLYVCFPKSAPEIVNFTAPKPGLGRGKLGAMRPQTDSGEPREARGPFGGVRFASL